VNTTAEFESLQNYFGTLSMLSWRTVMVSTSDTQLYLFVYFMHTVSKWNNMGSNNA